MKNTLAPHGLKSWAQQFGMEAKEAPEDRWFVTKSFSIADFDVGAVSYDLIKEIYLWFGFEEDKIPYTKEENGIKMVDSDAIVRGGEN